MAAFAVASTTLVLAEGGNDIKRPVQRDAPGPAFDATPLPEGEHITELAAPRPYGGLLVVPPGGAPTIGPATVNNTGSKVAPKVDDPSRGDDSFGLLIPSEALPAGYVAKSATGDLATRPDGSVIVATSSVQYSDESHFPITIARWLPAESFSGQSFPVVAWLSGTVMTTLGYVDGREAVFVHRRPGTKSAELQQVFFTDGPYVVLVEGYVDNFDTLTRMAAAASAKLRLSTRTTR